MNTSLQECLAEPNGARFFRGDLHIHSYEASHDVADRSMTPAAIVTTAVQEKLAIIAIADHNEIGNVAAAVADGDAAGVLVIPAVELSTPEGHLLCYFSDISRLAQFHGRLSLAGRGTQDSRCRSSMRECLDLAMELSGFCILAHVDGGNGYETNNPGGAPAKQDIICHPALLGIELVNAASVVTFTMGDPDPARVQLGKLRNAQLGYGEKQALARVLNSDSHKLAALGRNAAEAKKLTRYKMTKPSFEGLRHALEEGDSRIRLEDEIPSTTPYVLGANFVGGFLRDQRIHFSSNLNCIIGGRGTGKSTTFEAVRCMAGGRSKENVVDSEVWPESLHLFWQDEAGTQHSLLRPIHEGLINLDDNDGGPVNFDIDCFGQGEAARVREEARDDPLALMRYLDTFTGVADVLAEEEQARKDLLPIQAEIRKADEHIAQVPNAQRNLQVVRDQLRAFEAVKGKEVIALQRSLSVEKAAREEVAKSDAAIKEHIASMRDDLSAEAMRLAICERAVETGREEADEIVHATEAFDAEVSRILRALEQAHRALSTVVSTANKRWATKEAPLRSQIEEKRKILETQKVVLDLGHITQLSQQEIKLDSNLKKLKSWEPFKAEQEKKYRDAIRKRWESRLRVNQLRQQYAIKASRALGEVLTDLNVKLQYGESDYSTDAVEVIVKAMNWRTVNHNKARTLVSSLGVPKLIQALRAKQVDVISLEDDLGLREFPEAEAKHIVDLLSAREVLDALDLCKVDDAPRLTVTKIATRDGQKPRVIQKEFSELSLGQQQSVLLALILSSDSKRPLIIDQPEDNLDSEFIFHTFVPVLRRAKERRQVIIVTHNANIAVLGDAEQLIVLKSNAEHSKVVARGSIDDDVARDAACNVLEGAKEAFTRRAKIYGLGR